MKYLLISFVMLFVLCSMNAQVNQTTLSEKELIDIVMKYHPIAKQADLAVSMSDAQLLNARGGFDPIIQYGAAKKELGNLLYYNYQTVDLKIPTWYGIEIVAGLENTSGLRIDPQETLGNANYLGVNIPLLKNLIFDKRRAALQQAKVMIKQSKTERLIILNDLIYDALNAYWLWVMSQQKLSIYSKIIDNNKQRIDFTKQMIESGERPAIDSIEAISQLQVYEAMYNEVLLESQNNLLQLSVYTWKENSLPYDLPAELRPADIAFDPLTMQFETTTLQEFKETMLAKHPELLQYQNKFDWLQIQKKLKFQELLPTLNGKYNFIAKGNNITSTAWQPILQNNFQYNIAFSMPLRLSEGRAEYKLANMKILDTKYSLNLKRLNMLTKIESYYNTLKTLQQQIFLQKALLDNQSQLLSGEETRFSNGESSLFLVNSREQKRIETLQKMIETIAKYYKQKVAMKWITGVLGQTE